VVLWSAVYIREPDARRHLIAGRGLLGLETTAIVIRHNVHAIRYNGRCGRVNRGRRDRACAPDCYCPRCGMGRSLLRPSHWQAARSPRLEASIEVRCVNEAEVEQRGG